MSNQENHVHPNEHQHHMNSHDHMMHEDHSEHMHHQTEMTHNAHANHGESMDHSMHMGNLKVTFIVSLLLSIPIILLSPMMGINLPFQITFPGSDWLVLIFASILFIYGGRPF